MAQEITEIPTTAIWAVLLALVMLWLGHRLALSREKKKAVGQSDSVRPLSQYEKDILIAASAVGTIQIMAVDLYGEWVRVDKTDFIDKTDRAFAAGYREALQHLISQGFVMQQGRNYALTGTGFLKARSLKGPTQS
jgi:hypothetical protein